MKKFFYIFLGIAVLLLGGLAIVKFNVNYALNNPETAWDIEGDKRVFDNISLTIRASREEGFQNWIVTTKPDGTTTTKVNKNLDEYESYYNKNLSDNNTTIYGEVIGSRVQYEYGDFDDTGRVQMELLIMEDGESLEGYTSCSMDALHDYGDVFLCLENRESRTALVYLIQSGETKKPYFIKKIDNYGGSFKVGEIDEHVSFFYTLGEVDYEIEEDEYYEGGDGICEIFDEDYKVIETYNITNSHTTLFLPPMDYYDYTEIYNAKTAGHIDNGILYTYSVDYHNQSDGVSSMESGVIRVCAYSPGKNGKFLGSASIRCSLIPDGFEDEKSINIYDLSIY